MHASHLIEGYCEWGGPGSFLGLRGMQRAFFRLAVAGDTGYNLMMTVVAKSVLEGHLIFS